MHASDILGLPLKVQCKKCDRTTEVLVPVSEEGDVQINHYNTMNFPEGWALEKPYIGITKRLYCPDHEPSDYDKD